MKGGVVLRLLLYWLRALRASIGVLLRLAERALHRVPGCRLLRALHPWPRDRDGAPTSRRIVATWQRGEAGIGDWSKIQEQPPRRRVDGDGTCTHGPESQLPATSSLQSLFDGAGRLDLAGLRKAVYETGTDASERKVTWKFLFGVYPADSTTEERRRLDQQLVARYRSMKNAWKQQFPSARRMKVQSDLELSLAIMKYEQQEMEAAKVPAEHGLWLQSINQPQFWASLRDIDADVPRTDRHRSFFQRQGLVKLLYLREILITFAAFHQDIGYCQGMTSFASHFLETLDSEFDAFWCFVNCMRHWAPSLTAQGVACKIREQQGPVGGGQQPQCQAPTRAGLSTVGQPRGRCCCEPRWVGQALCHPQLGSCQEGP
ncbi:uncharacterized protein LOC120391261 [Mauremys reevesii]|uniref:uncharacterized protein LOC120391261 n=1 Tax=Mauremys reevesii TaxID=260615 RepID=UPI00193FA7C6|nr:uncharacterized protein LOC120391261 [Mauremys reevesii]